MRSPWIKRWLGEPGMNVDVVTDWRVGGPIVITGFHHASFENRGNVLRAEPPVALAYSHLSSLVPVERGTSWTLTIHGFPTESVRKHLDFYWRGTLPLVKRLVEERP